MTRRPTALLGLLIGLLLGVGQAPAVATDPPQISFAWIGSNHPPRYQAGDLVTFGVAVSTDEDDLNGEPIELQLKQAGSSTFTTYPGTIVEGYVEVRVKLRFDARYRWHHAASVRASEATTPVLSQAVSPRVGAVVRDRTLRVGQRLVISGRISPAAPGRIVRLWDHPAEHGLVRSTGFVLLARAYVRADGSYRLTRVFRHPGKRRVYVTVAASNHNDQGYSTYRHIWVRARG